MTHYICHIKFYTSAVFDPYTWVIYCFNAKHIHRPFSPFKHRPFWATKSADDTSAVLTQTSAVLTLTSAVLAQHRPFSTVPGISEGLLWRVFSVLKFKTHYALGSGKVHSKAVRQKIARPYSDCSWRHVWRFYTLGISLAQQKRDPKSHSIKINKGVIEYSSP